MGNDKDQNGPKMPADTQKPTLERLKELAYKRRMNQLRKEKAAEIQSMKEASTGQPESRSDTERAASSEPPSERPLYAPKANQNDIDPGAWSGPNSRLIHIEKRTGIEVWGAGFFVS